MKWKVYYYGSSVYVEKDGILPILKRKALCYLQEKGIKKRKQIDK